MQPHQGGGADVFADVRSRSDTLCVVDSLFATRCYCETFDVLALRNHSASEKTSAPEPLEHVPDHSSLHTQSTMARAVAHSFATALGGMGGGGGGGGG